MKYIMSRESHSILKQLAHHRTLCAFDFDGTLAPIVSHPDQATLSQQTREALNQLALLYPCVVISGRSREDVSSKLYDIPLAGVIGNHGAEGESDQNSQGFLREAKETLRVSLKDERGVWIEDKGLSIAVHYRDSKNKIQAREAIRACVRTMSNVRIFGGKYVVNIAPANAPHKGDALAKERDRMQCDWVLYAGDDDNDEDAFALGGNLVSVRIGRRQKSVAKYYLRAQLEIDSLLQCLVRLRETTHTLLD